MRSITKSKARAAIDHRSVALALTLTLALTLAPGAVSAQGNPLSRPISLELHQTRLDDALDRVGTEGRFTFSYNPDILRLDSLVDLHARHEQVRDVTNTLLGPRYELQSVGNHVVLRLVKAKPLKEELPKFQDISGFLIDAETGDKVRFATVFENARRNSVLTDPQGHYAITVPGDVRQVELAFSKKGFRDTVLVVDPRRTQQLTVGLKPIPGYAQPLASKPVTNVGLKARESLPLVELFVPQKQRTLTDNLLETLRSFPFQISLVPSIGTNKLLSGGMDNNFSLNILAGYCNSVNGLEVGGLANMDRANVRGLQVGGLANIVGGDVQGMQVGGLVNYVKGTVTGFQVAGLVNYVPHPVRGFQVAGIANVVPAEVNKLQVAGIYNLGHAVDGAQVAGIHNRAKGPVGGFQIGGIYNQAEGDVGGFQIGGIANHARGNVGGFQIAGIANVATGNVAKSQIAGIVNKAKIVNGCQIGLVNIADSVGGALIGLFNVVKKGYRVIEVGSNDVTQAQVAYKTGRAEFYNILSLGYRFGPGHFALAYGAGFGFSRGIGPLRLGFELTANDVIEQGLGPGRLNLLVPARLSLGIPLGDRLELFAGGALNVQVTNPQNGLGEFQSQLGPNPLWRHDGQRTRTQVWAGYQGGLRFHLWRPAPEPDQD